MDVMSSSQSSRLSIPRAWPFKRSVSSTSHDRERRKRAQHTESNLQSTDSNASSPPRSSPLPQTAWEQVPVSYRPHQLVTSPWEAQVSKSHQRVPTTSSVRRSMDSRADFPTRRQLEPTPLREQLLESRINHDLDAPRFGLGLRLDEDASRRLDSVMDISDLVHDGHYLDSSDLRSPSETSQWAPSPTTPMTPIAPLRVRAWPQARERAQTDSIVTTSTDGMLSDVAECNLFAQATAGFLTPEEEVLSLIEEVQDAVFHDNHNLVMVPQAFSELVSPISQFGTLSREAPPSPIPSSLRPGRLTYSTSTSGRPYRDQQPLDDPPLDPTSSTLTTFSPVRPARASWPRLESPASLYQYTHHPNNATEEPDHDLYPAATPYRAFTPLRRPTRQESVDLTAIFPPGVETPKLEEDLPDYAASQAQAQAVSRGAATRRAQELQRRWMQSR